MDEWGEWEQAERERERMEQRRDADEQVIQQWAQTNSDPGAVPHVRRFLANVRRDIGANGVITEVKVAPAKDGLEIAAVYYIENDPDGNLPGLLPSTTARSMLRSGSESETAPAGCVRSTPFRTGGLSVPMKRFQKQKPQYDPIGPAAGSADNGTSPAHQPSAATADELDSRGAQAYESTAQPERSRRSGESSR